MKPNYNNLWKLLIEKGMTKTELRVKAEMSTSTLAKMGKNEVVSMNVIIKICEILDCNVSDVMTVDKISEQTSLYIIYNIQEERQQGKLLGVLEKEERQDRQKIKKSLAYFPNMKKARLSLFPQGFLLNSAFNKSSFLLPTQNDLTFYCFFDIINAPINKNL